MKYRPDIDGLRAIAVLSVLLFHAGATVFSGGFVGVDIFLVISGYVIAQTLEDDLKTGKYSIWLFYSKRIRRIFPALYSTLLITFVVGWFMLPPNYFRRLSESGIAASAFSSNFYFWHNAGYFSPDSRLQPLLHTWSLAVEEQYYLFVPVIMYGVFKYFKRRWMIFFLPVLLLSLALSAYLTNIAPAASFYLLPTRAWEFLIGALLALSATKKLHSRWANESLSALGLLLIGYSVFAFSTTTPFPGLNALYPCLGAGLIIYTNKHASSFVGKILSFKPLVGIGRMSYSLYLVHWPVIVFFYFHTLAPATAKEIAPILGITFALSYLSWRYVEQPFRHLEGRVMQDRLLAGGLIAIVSFCILSSIGMFFDGFPYRFATTDKPQGLPGFTMQNIESKERWNTGTCFFWKKIDLKKWDYDTCQITAGNNQTALLWGDSYAAQYVPGIIENKQHIPFNIIQYTAAGCPPALSYHSNSQPECAAFNQHALDIIREHKIGTVVLTARWTAMELEDLRQIKSTLDVLDKMGVQTYIIGQSPEFSIDVQVLAFKNAGATQNGLDKWNESSDPKVNTTLENLAGSHSFIDPIPSLCDHTLCTYRDHGKFIYTDVGHLSAEGSVRAVRLYFPLFQKE